MDLRELRLEYQSKELSKKMLQEHPYEQFKQWFDEACHAEAIEPNAFALATCSSDAVPTCRIVLMKLMDQRGICFFTNLGSRKATQLRENPRAAASFWWRELEREVLLEGEIEELTQQESADYFSRRPRKSQLGAWSSRQSAVIPSRELLEKQYKAREKEFEGAEIPKPPFWGGYRLKPSRYEFWQGRRSRLHDRLEYQWQEGLWVIRRLSP